MHTILVALLFACAQAEAPPAAPQAEPVEHAPSHTFDVDGSSVTVVLQPGALDLPAAQVFAQVEKQARAVGRYYGEFPVDEARIEITPGPGRGVGGGVCYPGPVPTIRFRLGKASTVDNLERDWVVTHELTHLALPRQPRPHHWLEEGMATYVEPWARVGIGQVEPAQVWLELVQGLPKGLPADGDRGLDHTPTWGRTYWGGALFWFLADLEIHRRTDNEKGVREALVGVVAAGLDASMDGDLAAILKAGDEAVGHPVLAELYAAMRADPHPVDLDALWAELGVVVVHGAVRFDDGAPRAATRLAMSAR